VVLTWACLVTCSLLGEDLYDLFGKYGAIRQIRLGNAQKTRGTAFVVYEEVADVSRLTTRLGPCLLAGGVSCRFAREADNVARSFAGQAGLRSPQRFSLAGEVPRR